MCGAYSKSQSLGASGRHIECSLKGVRSGFAMNIIAQQSSDVTSIIYEYARLVEGEPQLSLLFRSSCLSSTSLIHDIQLVRLSSSLSY